MGYTHSDIGHNWAHQLESCQGDRYFSFDGSVIKSYTTVIGEIVHTKNGTSVFFLNTGNYSKSTCKHQNYAFSAIPGDAVKFSVSCGDFMFHWDGITNWDGEITEPQAKKFVVKNLQHVVNLLLEFKESKSLKIEKEFSLHYFDEAVRFLQYFPLTSFSKILRMKNDTLKAWFYIDKPTVFRKVVKAIMAGNRELKSLVDVANGEGAYNAYYKRTLGIRMSGKTRKYNHICGFDAVGFMDKWYEPYPYCYTVKKGSRFTKNETYISNSFDSCGDKGFTSKQILQHRENGDLIATLCQARKENLAKAFAAYATKRRNQRVQAAKERLEIFIGLRGWDDYLGCKYKHRFSSFNYNGIEYTFNRWNEERELSPQEYAAFTKMSPEEQKAFIRDKRAEMLEVLRQQDYDYEHRQEIAEKARLEQEKRLAEKREYIERKKAEGDEGVRQLWREGLVESWSLWNKPNSFFFGGNVLLRVRDSIVETSKGIRVPIKECKRLWGVIKRWHDNHIEFGHSSEEVHATSNTWQIQRFQHEIMIAGCHAVSYNEMARVAIECNFYE